VIAALTTDGRVEVSGLLTPSTDGTPTGQSTTLDPAPDGAAIPGVVVVLYLPARDVDPSEVLRLIWGLR
jgi:hypothetical protein